MSGKGWCADKHIKRTAAYLLQCPRLLRACKFSQRNNQPTKGSAKVGGGGGGDINSDGSGNNGKAMARWRCNGDGDLH
jgi:hypothetical protein